MDNRTKRIAAIHDISCFGKASLTIVIPVLSAMGHEVCPLPTALLSTHTAFPNFTHLDLTDEMKKIIEHWKTLDIKFDAIYSGYLGSPEQAEVVSEFIWHFRKDDQLVIVDPVMADNGKFYHGFDETMAEKMRGLIGQADIITPNLTEAAFLLDKPYRESLDIEEIKRWLDLLSQMGPQTVIITGIPELDIERTGSVVAYDRANNRKFETDFILIPGSYSGTGDSFASFMLGSLLHDGDVKKSIEIAVSRVWDAVHFTYTNGLTERGGVVVEGNLHNGCLYARGFRSYDI